MVLDKMVQKEMVRIKWYGQNVTDKMVAIFIDFNSIELNLHVHVYSLITSHKQ